LGAAVTPRDAARGLSVDAVFTGSMRLSGDQVKVRIELVDGQGFQLWSDTFTSSRTGAIASEQKMAEEILARVRGALAAKQ
jgi:TolB-like protein